MYIYEIAPKLKKILNKIYKKDKALYEQIINKTIEIINSENIEHYKNLRYNMKEYKRVHLGPFVLIFKLENNLIKFEDLDHHDNIYK